MEELLNQRWRAHVRHIPAASVYDAIANIAWNDDDAWSWCVHMTLDASGTPRVMTDYGVCPDDELPEADDGGVLIACPLTEDTTKQDLLEFDAASESEWEDAFGDGDDEDENDDEDEGEDADDGE